MYVDIHVIYRVTDLCMEICFCIKLLIRRFPLRIKNYIAINLLCDMNDMFVVVNAIALVFSMYDVGPTVHVTVLIVDHQDIYFGSHLVIRNMA